MSNHSGSYMLCEILTLMQEAGVWEKLPRPASQQLVIDIVKLAYDRYDCNAGEILEGHEELGICYSCRKPVAALRQGLCEECGWDDEEEDEEDEEA